MRKTSLTQHGLTLVELMVVVAIAGVLLAAATVSIKRSRDVMDSANVFATKLRECNHIAVMNGAVRSDVIAGTGISARARLVVSYEPDNGQQSITIDILREDAEPAATASWKWVSSAWTGKDVLVKGYAAATLNSGATMTDLPLTTDLEIQCFSDGTSTSRTVYLEEGDTGTQRARVTVLPLTSEVVINRSW